MIKSRTYIATPPGATIKEQLIDRGLTQKEFSIRMGLSEKHISRLISGDVQLTPDVAHRLEMVLGIPANFWSNLEAIYREKVIKANEENQMDEDIEIAKKMPYKEMAKYSWIPDRSKNVDKVINLRKYFEVTRLSYLTNFQLNQIACRRQSQTDKSDYALIAWAQEAKLEAREIETSDIDLKTLSEKLPEIRKMSTKNPKDFCPELRKILADCGIALIFLPHISGSFLSGATFYDGNKIVVGLTVRGKDADKFWFSFFHEIGHVLLGHINNKLGLSEDEEKEADQFARDSLIPPEKFNQFIEKRNINKKDIISFAESMGIDCGIVVGRLQIEGVIDFGWFNDLKKQYVIN